MLKSTTWLELARKEFQKLDRQDYFEIGPKGMLLSFELDLLKTAIKNPISKKTIFLKLLQFSTRLDNLTYY